MLLLLRDVLPAAFTSDEEVQALVRSLLPPLALYVVADASQARKLAPPEMVHIAAAPSPCAISHRARAHPCRLRYSAGAIPRAPSHGRVSQVCCGGVLQGCGRQRRGIPVVPVCFYGVALPTGCALGFFAGWGARGMVVGMLGGKLLHAAAFAVLVATTDWENERRRATRRVGGGSELL